MNLNGGYIMLDLDDTSNLLTRIQKVYGSGKPLVVKYNDRLQFANFAKRASTSSNYDITLSDNTKLSIHAFSGALSESIVLDTKKYRHISTVTFQSAGATQTLITEVINNEKSAYSNGAMALRALSLAGFKSENTMTLCVYSGNYAQVYVVADGGGVTLHYKPSGATAFSTIIGSQITFVADSVTEI